MNSTFVAAVTSQYSMKNHTQLSDEFTFRFSVWLTEFIVTVAVLIVSIYLIITLTYHWLRCNRETKRAHRSRETQLSNTTKKICIAIAIMTFLYQVLSLGYLLLEKHVSSQNLEFYLDTATVFCKILTRARVSVLIVATGLTYLFLWERQRVFYINPSLKVLNSNLIKATSYLVLIVWVAYFIPVVIIYCVIVQYELQYPEGCRAVRGSLRSYRSIIVSWHSVSAFMQLALLGLFINPMFNRLLILSQSKRKKQGSSRKSSISRLMSRVKRAVIITTICLISDVVSGISVILLFRLNTNNFTFPYNINLVVNLFGVIGCFDNWKNIVWPLAEKESQREGSSKRKNTSFTQVNSGSAPSFIAVEYSGSTPSGLQGVRKKNSNSCLPPRCIAFSDSDLWNLYFAHIKI